MVLKKTKMVLSHAEYTLIKIKVSGRTKRGFSLSDATEQGLYTDYIQIS